MFFVYLIYIFINFDYDSLYGILKKESDYLYNYLYNSSKIQIKSF